MTGPTKNRDELISSFSSRLFSAMLQEVIMDAALQSHKEIARSKAVCTVCGTRCGLAHAQGGHADGAGLSTNTLSSISHQAANSPQAPISSIAGTSTPTIKEKGDINIYFECTNCQKKIASNRYAPHLSGCLGIGTGSRRGAARNAAAKNKLGAEVDRGGSPLVGSEYGSPSHEPVNGRGKAKGKNSKKLNGKIDDNDLNDNQKRIATPDGSPAKKSKKQKISTADPDAPLIKDDSLATKVQTNASIKIPLKLGNTTASPYVPGSPSAASGSQYSGHDDSPSASASRSVSSVNAQSPTASRGSKPPKVYKSSSGLMKKRGRPPGSGKNQIAAAEAKRKTEDDPDFIDVDGEEQEEDSSDSS